MLRNGVVFVFKFAENACGMVQVFLNGSISNAFDKTSTFGRVEVHSLQPSKVHTLKAWVIHDSGKTPRDTCSGSSINELQLILRGKNIKFTCQENYRPI